MIRAFQWDLARQVERLDWLLAQLPRYASWGYQELYLHLEDAVEYPSLPSVARGDAYTYRQLGKLVAAAGKVGIGVVPIVNLLGHTQYLIKTSELRDLNELRAADGSPRETGQICPVHPRTIEVAEKLLRDMAPFCTAGKVHVGLDESFHLGRHPLSRKDIARRGLAGHFVAYVARLHGLVTGLGLRMGLWADMLYFLPEAIAQLPSDVIAYDWYYYPFRRHPRVEIYNFAERDLATPLRARGIEYWGCPMNGAFRFEPLPLFGERLDNIKSWWRRCEKTGAGGFLVTSWEAYRLAIEMTTVVDAAAASLWLDADPGPPAAMLARGFSRVFGPRGAGAAAQIALEADSRAFVGNARWEINQRWDVAGAGIDLRPYILEEKFFANRLRRRLPAAFAASVAFRLYLARRDVFVRTAGQGVLELRRRLEYIRKTDGAPATAAAVRKFLIQQRAEAKKFQGHLAAGLLAARAMWARTRTASVRGQNELILRADAVRLHAWTHWLEKVRGDVAASWTSSPVVGAWQLCLRVHNFAPALQKLVVEKQDPPGGWTDIYSRIAIEFRAAAARRRGTLCHEFCVAVPGPGQRLRLGVRGVGELKLSGIRLTNGAVTLRPRDRALAGTLRLGRPAPTRGLPALDWQRNLDEVVVEFDPPHAR